MKLRKNILGSIAFGVVASVTLVACGEVSVIKTPQPPVDTNPNQPTPTPQPPVDTNPNQPTPTPQPPVYTNPGQPTPKPEPTPHPEPPKSSDPVVGDGDLFKDFTITLNNNQIFPSDVVNRGAPFFVRKAYFTITKATQISDQEITIKALSLNDYSGKLELEVTINHGGKTATKIYQFQTGFQISGNSLSYSYIGIINFKPKANLTMQEIDKYITDTSHSWLGDDQKIEKLKTLGEVEFNAELSNFKLPRSKLEFDIKSIKKENDQLVIEYIIYSKMYWKNKNDNIIHSRHHGPRSYVHGTYFYKIEINLPKPTSKNAAAIEIFNKISVKPDFDKGYIYPSWYKFIFKKWRDTSRGERDALFDMNVQENIYAGKNFYESNGIFRDKSELFTENYLSNSDGSIAFINNFFNFPSDFKIEDYVVNVSEIVEANDVEGSLTVRLGFAKRYRNEYLMPTQEIREIYAKTFKITGLNKWTNSDYDNFRLEAKNAEDFEKGNFTLNSWLNLSGYNNKSNIDAKFEEKDAEIPIEIPEREKKDINIIMTIVKMFYKNNRLSILQPENYPFPVKWFDTIHSERIKIVSAKIINKQLHITFEYQPYVEGSELKMRSQTLIYGILKKTENDKTKYIVS
ncbi:lipoprotein 17-related variable surface protein [Candidatus Mycoplasma pogonae]